MWTIMTIWADQKLIDDACDVNRGIIRGWEKSACLFCGASQNNHAHLKQLNCALMKTCFICKWSKNVAAWAIRCTSVTLPVSTDVNGCSGSKGHFSLPDSTVVDSSRNTPSWQMKRKITTLFQTFKSNSWPRAKLSPAENCTLRRTLPLCGQRFQQKRSSGGKLPSHRRRRAFDCSCGWPWRS